MLHASSFGPQRALRWGLVPASLALLTLTGCGGGLFKRNQVPDYSNLNASEPLTSYDKLNEKQVSELKFAAARTQESGGALEEALQGYQEVAKLDPKRADVPHRIAIVYDKLAQFNRSPEYYQKALQLNPGNADIYCDIGYSQYLQQRFQDAEMNLRQAVKIKPDHGRACNNLGMVLAHTGRVDESLQAFQRGGAKPQDAHTNVAFALAAHGHFDDARKHYKLALAHDPEFAKAQEGLSDITRLQEKAERIRAVAQEFGTLEQEPLATYAAPNAMRSTVVGPHAAVARAGRANPESHEEESTTPVTATAPVERKQASAEPAPWARQITRPAVVDAPPAAVAPMQLARAAKPAAAKPTAAKPAVEKPAVEKPAVEKPAVVETPAAVETPAVAVLPASEKPAEKPVAAKPAKAPKLSFSKGALHRDRYLEEQTDPALQQAGFSTAE